MKTWYYALYTSLASFVLLMLVLFLPRQFSVFTWSKSGTSAGNLLPLMFIIWLLSLAAFALNNVFVDKCYISQDMKMHPLLKYLPSLFGMPVLFSFIWVVYRVVKELPMG